MPLVSYFYGILEKICSVHVSKLSCSVWNFCLYKIQKSWLTCNTGLIEKCSLYAGAKFKVISEQDMLPLFQSFGEETQRLKIEDWFARQTLQKKKGILKDSKAFWVLPLRFASTEPGTMKHPGCHLFCKDSLLAYSKFLVYSIKAVSVLITATTMWSVVTRTVFSQLKVF